MSIKSIGTVLGNVGSRIGFVLKKHSPEIFIGAGLVLGVGATILACKATLKVEVVLDEHNEKIEKIKYAREQVALDTYTDDDYRRDMLVTYFQTSVEFCKVYGPSVILGIVSMGCIIKGHNILRRRNIALAVAFTSLKDGFDLYRKRVVEEYGPEKDYMFYHGLRAEEYTETITDEKGKTKEVVKTKLVKDPNLSSSKYSKIFSCDTAKSAWSNTPIYNAHFLQCQQNIANNLLQSQKYLFLNDVYDMLSIQRTPEGQIVGWRLNGNGDGYVDFGLTCNSLFEDSLAGYQVEGIPLDFNVDGEMWNSIDDL